MARSTIPQIETQIRCAKRKLAYERKRAGKLAQLAALHIEIASIRMGKGEIENLNKDSDDCPCNVCTGTL